MPIQESISEQAESDNDVEIATPLIINHKQAQERLNELHDYFLARKDDCKDVIENLYRAEIMIKTREASKQSSIDSIFKKI